MITFETDEQRTEIFLKIADDPDLVEFGDAMRYVQNVQQGLWMDMSQFKIDAATIMRAEIRKYHSQRANPDESFNPSIDDVFFSGVFHRCFELAAMPGKNKIENHFNQAIASQRNRPKFREELTEQESEDVRCAHALVYCDIIGINVKERAYNYAHNEGFKKGRTEGFNRGHDEGHEAGEKRGYIDGVRKGKFLFPPAPSKGRRLDI